LIDPPHHDAVACQRRVNEERTRGTRKWRREEQEPLERRGGGVRVRVRDGGWVPSGEEGGRENSPPLLPHLKPTTLSSSPLTLVHNAGGVGLLRSAREPDGV